MAQPYPPQGNQSQHTERPLKVYAEQMITGQPIPIGVRTDPPAGVVTAPAFVVTGGVYYPVNDTDWVISSRYNGQVIEVISDEEFKERFGGGGGNPLPADT